MESLCVTLSTSRLEKNAKHSCANFESGPADSKDANHALVCVHGALNPQLTQPPLVVDCETSHELFKLFPHTKRPAKPAFFFFF